MISKAKNKLQKLQNEPEETKIKIIWILVAFCMFIITIGFFISFGSKKPVQRENKSILSSFPDLKNELNDINEISKNYSNIKGETLSKIEEENAKIIINNYIIEENYLEGGEIKDLKLKNTEKWKDNWYLEYEQYYNTILVNDSKIVFVVNIEQEEVISAQSNFNSKIEIKNTELLITEEKAYELIAEKLQNEEIDLTNSEIVIYKDINKKQVKYYLAWKINIISIQSVDYTDDIYFVNAENGEITSFSK